MEDKMKGMVPDWAKGLNCGIIVCNKQGVVVYMNDAATAFKQADLTGINIFDCHNPTSVEIINRMLETGGDNMYTVEKNGVKKLIYQSAWTENGEVAGLCEIMAVFEGTLPHRVRLG